jgi:hypothetical protein
VQVEQIIGVYLAVLPLQQTLELKEIQEAVLVVAAEQIQQQLLVLVEMVFRAVVQVVPDFQEPKLIRAAKVGQV